MRHRLPFEVAAVEVFEAIKSRRSVRRYRREDVPDELVLKVLEAARWAPSSKNRQPWSFVVVRNPVVKKELAKLAAFGGFLAEAPVVIAVVTDPRASPRFHEVDGSCAVENMMLAAWSLGLGTCWIGTMDREGAKQLLGVPEELNLLTVIPLGYPAEESRAPSRKSLDELVYWERFGQRKSD